MVKLGTYMIAWPKEPADAPPVVRKLDGGTREPFERAMASGRFRRISLVHEFTRAEPRA